MTSHFSGRFQVAIYSCVQSFSVSIVVTREAYVPHRERTIDTFMSEDRYVANDASLLLYRSA